MEKIIGTSKVSRRFQITLTKIVREKLCMEKIEGLIVFVEKDGDIVIRKS